MPSALPLIKYIALYLLRYFPYLEFAIPVLSTTYIKQDIMFNLISKIFSLIYLILTLSTWIVKISWKLVILLTFLECLYKCLLRIHQACKYTANWDKQKDKENVKVTRKSAETFHRTIFAAAAYEDDIHPDDSVSVVSAFSSKDSDGSVFENIDDFQV